jgi:hypothetical protein
LRADDSVFGDTSQVAASGVPRFFPEVAPSTWQAYTSANHAPIDPELSALFEALEELQVHELDQGRRTDRAHESSVWQDFYPKVQPT